MVGFALSLVLGAASGPPPITSELVPPGEPINLQFMLRLADVADAKADLKGRNKANFPTAEAIGERYGQSPETFRKLQSWITGAGFKLADVEGVGRMVIFATGNAAKVTQLLGVRLHRVKGQPPHIHAPDRKPTLPDWVKKAVQDIEGLDNRPGRAKPKKKYR
jgi:hypothetical protein